MRAALSLARAIDAINTFAGKAVSWLLLAAVLISAGNAVVRKALNVSSNAWLEAQWYLVSAVFLIAAAFTLLENEHVKVDLLYGKLSRKAQIWIEILGITFFLFPFCAITIYLAAPVVLAKYASGEMSNNTGGLILWPAWALIPAGFGLLFLQGLSELTKRIAILLGAAPDPVALADEQAARL